MTQKSDKKTLLTFLKNNIWGVLSTVDKKGSPHAAPLYYVVDEHFNLFFITPKKTQKSLNIDFRKEVVFTITDETKKQTLQIRGLAEKEEALIPEIVKGLAQHLNRGSNFLTNLPLFAYKNQEKTGVVIRPKKVCMKSYFEEGMKEITMHFKA